MALHPRRCPAWTRQLDDALLSLRSRKTPDERISQVVGRDLADIADRVEQLRAEGRIVSRRTPAEHPNRRLPTRHGPLDCGGREVLAVLRGRGLSTTAIAVHLGRAYAPVRVAVAAYDREHRHD